MPKLADVPAATDNFIDVKAAARRRAVARDHQQRSVALIRARDTDRAPHPMTNAPEVYTDPAWAAAEKREIFRKLPLLAGLSADIPKPGDKMIFDAVGPSILIVRTQQNEVKAFLNMCMHRAARLVTHCTNGTRMTCPFHAWTFDLDGRLIAQPSSESFAGIARSDRNLIPVPVVEWHGMIFLRAQAGGEPIDIEAFLGSFAPELAQLNLAHVTLAKQTRLEVESNWKYALDTYGEAYHFGALHPTTIGSSHFTDIMCYDDFAPHHRIAFPYRYVSNYAAKPESEWPEEDFNAIHLLFPNVIFNIWKIPEGHAYAIYRIFPGETPDRAFTLTATYRPTGSDPKTGVQPWIDLHDFIEKVVTTEDYIVSKGGQSNLRYAPPGFELLYGSNEIALQNFHKQIAARVAPALRDASAVK